jgi:hypothetical protein
LVCTLEKDGEGGYKKRDIINLDEREPETGKYVREVIETYHPATFGIQPVQHMFSSN